MESGQAEMALISVLELIPSRAEGIKDKAKAAVLLLEDIIIIMVLGTKHRARGAMQVLRRRQKEARNPIPRARRAVVV